MAPACCWEPVCGWCWCGCRSCVGRPSPSGSSRSSARLPRNRGSLRDADGPVTLFGPLERILRAVLKDAVGWLGRLQPGNAGPGTVRLAAGGTQPKCPGVPGRPVAVGRWRIRAGRRRRRPLRGGGTVQPRHLPDRRGGLALAAFLFQDYLLSAQIKRREAKMLAEFPGLAELMALAVSAGENATGALERVCRSSNGELAQEFGAVLAQTRSGIPLVEALTRVLAPHPACPADPVCRRDHRRSPARNTSWRTCFAPRRRTSGTWPSAS